MRVGRLMKAPKFITGPACEVPNKKLSTGICKRAPPPPLIVERVNVEAPKKNKPMSNQGDIWERISNSSR